MAIDLKKKRLHKITLRRGATELSPLMGVCVLPAYVLHAHDFGKLPNPTGRIFSTVIFVILLDPIG